MFLVDTCISPIEGYYQLVFTSFGEPIYTSTAIKPTVKKTRL